MNFYFQTLQLIHKIKTVLKAQNKKLIESLTICYTDKFLAEQNFHYFKKFKKSSPIFGELKYQFDWSI